MMKLNKERMETLLNFTHSHEDGIYRLYDNKGNYVDAYYDTDFESDNGLEEDQEGYEEYQSIVFRKVSDNSLFEVNYHLIPVKVEYEGETLY